MDIQKHSIYQINVPFETVVTEDEIIFSRYIMLNCFNIDNLTYVRIEIEEQYEHKTEPSNGQLIRVIDSLAFEERNLPKSLHVMMGGLSKHEISGKTEIIFAITIFTEIITKLDKEDKLKQFQTYFPDWNIEEFINEPTIPDKLNKLKQMKTEI